VMFSKDRMARKDLPQLEAMKRFRQERDLLRHQKIVKVPRPVIMCQGEVRQAVAANVQKEEKKVVTEPTTLAGAVKTLNALNDGKVTTAQQRLRDKETKVLDRNDSYLEFVAEVEGNPERERKPVVRLTPPVVNEVVMPVQQVLEPVRQGYEPVRQVLEPADKPMDVLDTGDGSDDPDRDRLTPPVVEKIVRLPVDVLDEEDDNDDPDRDRIVLQRLKVKLEVDWLIKYEEAYVFKMESKS